MSRSIRMTHKQLIQHIDYRSIVCEKCQKKKPGQGYVVGLGKLICGDCKKKWDLADAEQRRPEGKER